MRRARIRIALSLAVIIGCGALLNAASTIAGDDIGAFSNLIDPPLSLGIPLLFIIWITPFIVASAFPAPILPVDKLATEQERAAQASAERMRVLARTLQIGGVLLVLSGIYAMHSIDTRIPDPKAFPAGSIKFRALLTLLAASFEMLGGVAALVGLILYLTHRGPRRTQTTSTHYR